MKCYLNYILILRALFFLKFLFVPSFLIYHTFCRPKYESRFSVTLWALNECDVLWSAIFNNNEILESLLGVPCSISACGFSFLTLISPLSCFPRPQRPPLSLPVFFTPSWFPAAVPTYRAVASIYGVRKHNWIIKASFYPITQHWAIEIDVRQQPAHTADAHVAVFSQGCWKGRRCKESLSKHSQRQ